MAKRTLIIVVDTDLDTTHFLPQDKFLASELKGIAQLLRNNTAKLAMFSIDQAREKCICLACGASMPKNVKYCGKCGNDIKKDQNTENNA